MAIWDSFSGRKATATQDGGFDPTSAQDVSSFLQENALPDPSQLHPLAGLNQDALDYLTLEDSALDQLPGSRSALPSRGWSDDLCYGTGSTYLAGLTIGGAWGLAEGLSRTPANAAPKLRLNGVLNSITRRGPFLGNSAGVVAMVYNGLNSMIGYGRGKHDAANSIAAGALSGMIFKSTRGTRPMLISGGIVATIAGVWTVCFYPLSFVLFFCRFFLSLNTDYICRSLARPFSRERNKQPHSPLSLLRYDRQPTCTIKRDLTAHAFRVMHFLRTVLSIMLFVFFFFPRILHQTLSSLRRQGIVVRIF